MLQGQEETIGLLDKSEQQNDFILDPVSLYEKSEEGLGKNKFFQRTNLRTSIFLIIVSLLVLWSLLDISSRLFYWIQAKSKHHPCWCGSSDAEAIALGCIYDHIAVDWLPETCVDHELIADFDISGTNLDGTWPYFQRKKSIQSAAPVFTPINATEIDTYAREGKTYYTTTGWHIAHCMFTWRKQFRAGLTGKPIESWNNKEEHILHCNDYIVDVVRRGAGLETMDTNIHGRNRHSNE